MKYEEEKKKIEFDVHIFHEGNHFMSYSLLGAHINDEGVSFRVWAPNAKGLSVVGDFNNWDSSSHRMKKNNDFWILQVDGIKKGEKYKYAIETWSGKKLVKSDPYALYSELRPNTASIVWDLENYSWNDQEWKENKKSYQPYKKPMNIYEVHLGSWKKPEGRENFQTYRELAEELPKYVSEMGYTHVELMPISEYPLDDSWGYQGTGYFSVTSRHGIPEDFKYLIDEFHRYIKGVCKDCLKSEKNKSKHNNLS